MFKQKFGWHTLSMYAGNRARAALIHELLHLKYVEDEKPLENFPENIFASLHTNNPRRNRM